MERSLRIRTSEERKTRTFTAIAGSVWVNRNLTWVSFDVPNTRRQPLHVDMEPLNPLNQLGDALVQILRESQNWNARNLLETAVTAIQKFSVGEQSDDLTLVVARAR